MRNVFSTAEPKITPCETGYSFIFDLVGKELSGINTAPLHRICTLMRKMKVKCFVREELQHDAEIVEEVAALSVRTATKLNADAIRFTFFREVPKSGLWKDLHEKDILGYAVLLKFNPPIEIQRSQPPNAFFHGYVLEAVIIPPVVSAGNGDVECVTNYYIHTCREFETTVGTPADNKTFHLRGAFFCQQNGFTNACAHAALRMAINSWPVYQGAKVTYEKINQILGEDHSKKQKVPNQGLNAAKIASVIRALGHEAEIAEFVRNPEVNYEDYIYPLIESGCPIILAIQSPRVAHVVTVLGHTLNSDRWAEARHGYGTVPKAHYISASAWADHFIVNDDNYGMYLTLPSESVKNIIIPKYNPNLYASIGIGLFPEKPPAVPNNENRIFGYYAEQVAADIFLQKLLAHTTPHPSNRWFSLLKDRHTTVCRTVLRSKADYLQSLIDMVDEQGNKITEAEKKLVDSLLPDRVWVTEVMTPSLYVGNKRKLGEIIMKTKASLVEMQERKIFVFAWIAGVAWHGPDLKTGPIEWPVLGHVPLARGIPAEKCKLEW